MGYKKNQTPNQTKPNLLFQTTQKRSTCSIAGLLLFATELVFFQNAEGWFPFFDA